MIHNYCVQFRSTSCHVQVHCGSILKTWPQLCKHTMYISGRRYTYTKYLICVDKRKIQQFKQPEKQASFISLLFKPPLHGLLVMHNVYCLFGILLLVRRWCGRNVRFIHCWFANQVQYRYFIVVWSLTQNMVFAWRWKKVPRKRTERTRYTIQPSSNPKKKLKQNRKHDEQHKWLLLHYQPQKHDIKSWTAVSSSASQKKDPQSSKKIILGGTPY